MWLAVLTVFVHGFHLASIAAFREYRRSHAAAYVVVTLSTLSYCSAVSHEHVAAERVLTALGATNLMLAALAIPFLIVKRRAAAHS